MSKPVDKIGFWKHRIDTAQSEHYSVYVIHEQGWKRINDIHNEIFDGLIKKDDKVLDAGCGYGRWADKFDNYVGVDFSPDFIERAKKKYPNKEFIVAKLEELPFKDKEFDWAFCVSIKKMIVDNMGEEAWQKMEDELKRVAKKVLILEYEDPRPYEIL
jgi:ubiquinone/menaquinone biosynthesis C-methylase UbiE